MGVRMMKRLPKTEIEKQYLGFIDTVKPYALLEFIPEAVIVTNRQRQIVYANKAMLDLTFKKTFSDLQGLRPGEALKCIHTMPEKSECGLTKHCSQCGSMFALIDADSGLTRGRDFSLTRFIGGRIEAMDLKVYGSTVCVDDERFYVLSLIDISHEKRRIALERTFFHDILNTAGALQGLSALLKDSEGDELREYIDMVCQASDYLVSEIEAQRILRSAERGDLVIETQPIHSCRLMKDIVGMYTHHEIAQGKHIEMPENSQDFEFHSDRNLLRRVLGNMMKNALEASAVGDAVTFSCEKTEKDVIFRVHNPTQMTNEVQLQVFNRSFSTKGRGRGLGTYGMKLLTEQYLNGDVGFFSDESGTTFFIRCPIHST